ncbi:MAG: helix-turn-helix domain-containing protein [Kofleriaceae bacterium]
MKDSTTRTRGRGRRPAAKPAPVRAPRFQQERSRRTFEALVDAAEALFAEHGYDATGSPEIARKAGASVGTFYRYFDDKKQVFLEVVRRHLEQMMTSTLDGISPAALAGKARHETIAIAIDALFRSVTHHPGLSRTIEEMALRDPEVAALRHRYEQASRQRITQLVTLVALPEVVADPQATAWALTACAMECAAAAGGLRGAGAPSQARLRAALIAMVERLLFGDE